LDDPKPRDDPNLSSGERFAHALRDDTGAVRVKQG
jgi:hypothetical protein